MKITKTITKHDLYDLEPVEVNDLVSGGITESHKDGGCGTENCNCSPGHWVTINLPMDDNGDVETIRVDFENRDDLIRFIGDNSNNNNF